MNPILLKPEARRPLAGRRPRPADGGRVELPRVPRAAGASCWPVVAESLDRLRATYDVVVIEGAGSPAEINLRDARPREHARRPARRRRRCCWSATSTAAACSPRCVGTLALLGRRRARAVRGLIVNRFRGDADAAGARPRRCSRRAPACRCWAWCRGSPSARCPPRTRSTSTSRRAGDRRPVRSTSRSSACRASPTSTTSSRCDAEPGVRVRCVERAARSRAPTW